MVSGAMNQHPEAVHISESGKQIVRRPDVGSFGHGHVVVARSDQFLNFVADKSEALRNVDKCAILICYSRLSGWDARSREHPLAY